MRIAVDIDGILTIETEGWDYRNRTPHKETIRKVNLLFAQGHEIILFSARHIEDEDTTKRWLERHGVDYHCLQLGKIKYDIFVDDKAVSSIDDVHFGG